MLKSSAVLLLLGVVVANARENHFGTPCQLCECFIHYDDRDIGLALSPYKVIANAYDVTEDTCLAGCLKEDDCKAAVYGYVGGRNVFTCEYYNKISVQDPIYAPYTNIYLKRPTECKKQYLHYKTIEGEADDQTVVARKQRFRKVHERQNPFNFGRK
ncbi:hypothetical protein M3Y99_00859200 [Aphelenchoides fujianensis]|nr:hypothetical protein M3Y99_00859200 [Aphelenchoides fujianensis]